MKSKVNKPKTSLFLQYSPKGIRIFTGKLVFKFQSPLTTCMHAKVIESKALPYELDLELRRWIADNIIEGDLDETTTYKILVNKEE